MDLRLVFFVVATVLAAIEAVWHRSLLAGAVAFLAAGHLV